MLIRKKHKGLKKLEPKWTGPLQVKRTTKKGRALILKDLQTDLKPRKHYHINDVKMFVPRKAAKADLTHYKIICGRTRSK